MTPAHLDRAFASMGENLSRAGLAHRGKVHVGLAITYASELARVGWTAVHTDELASLVRALEDAISSQATMREETRARQNDVLSAVSDAKAFVRKLRVALPAALRLHAQPDGLETSFKVGRPLGTSASRISSYLSKIRPGVEKLAPSLTSLFEGTSPLTTLDAITLAIESTSTTFAVARRRLPETTLAINEAKGRVADCLRALLELARVVFFDAPDIAEKFSIDALGSVRSSPILTR
jgi:hypothetical protein